MLPHHVHWWWLSVGLAGLAVVIAGGVLDQRYVYYPAPWEAVDWARASQLPIEEIRFAASDGVMLHGWFVEAPQSPATLLLCHGNAGNIIHRLEHIGELHRRGLSVCIFDYRGYGQSAGRPSEPGVYRDAQAAYDDLTTDRHVDPRRLIVWGTSIGAAVAGDLAVHRPVAGVILETPLASVPALVRTYYGWVPLHWLLRARFDLLRRLPQMHAPILVMHGDRDRLVPLALGRRVYEAANAPKDFYLIHGADHNDTYLVGGDAYFQRVLAFIRQVVR